MVHHAITNFVNPTYCVLEGVSAQIPSWDIVASGKVIHSIPRGNDESERTSPGRWGRMQPILRRTGHLKREVISDTTCVGLKICTENFAHTVSTCVNISVVLRAQDFCGARSTELFSARGTGLFEVPGAHINCSAMTMVLGPIRSDKSFIFATIPLLIRVGVL